jgi:FkbM family methyltransferase
MFWFLIAKIYDNIYGLFKSVLKRNMRGIGFLLRKVKNDHVLDLDGQQLYFNHKVAGCYVRLINGNYTEVETHVFLKRIIAGITKEIYFIDVGANVGEMILDVARYQKVKIIYAFEPHLECAKACKISAILNGFDHKVVVLQKILSKDTNPIAFDFNIISPNASAITGSNDKKGVVVYPSTLDNELPDTIEHAMLLIDVEGAEPHVLKGGKHFIQKKLPLIIFEYNDLSKKYFTLDDIRNILGTDYNIYRLRQDGYLDRDYVNTWNCVAVNVNSVFYDFTKNLLRG